MSYRSKGFIGLLGEMQLDRAYYHCKRCGEGHVPWDAILHLSETRLTVAAEEVVTLSGIQSSFGKVAKRSLNKLTGLRLSESTVERTTEAAGERLGEQLENEKVFGQSESWEWNRDATGQTCGYISVDATGIQMQGEDGAKADGRMVYVGMIYNPEPRSNDDDAIAKPCQDVRYLAGLYSLEELGKQLRRQAYQVGLNEVERWIALSDAGGGLEHFVDVNFPLAVKILDFRHVTDYLTPLARLWKSGSESDAVLTEWCHELKHQGGQHLLGVLKSLEPKISDVARDQYEKTRTYFENHHHKMNYPEYLKNGWQIGSGCIESACKNVINQRLNMGGMRWGEEGSDAVSHLRALFLSSADQWDAFWAHAAA